MSCTAAFPTTQRSGTTPPSAKPMSRGRPQRRHLEMSRLCFESILQEHAPAATCADAVTTEQSDVSVFETATCADRIVDVPVVRQRQVPTIQTVQRTVHMRSGRRAFLRCSDRCSRDPGFLHRTVGDAIALETFFDEHGTEVWETNWMSLDVQTTF